MYKVWANEQVFPLDSMRQFPIGHLVSSLMSTMSTLSAVNNVNAVRCQQCQCCPLSTMSMLSTMSAVNHVKTPTPAACGGVSGGRPPTAAFSCSSACGGVWREYAACGGGFF
jgi:hypothetical protein